jgi:hypothetical protein
MAIAQCKVFIFHPDDLRNEYFSLIWLKAAKRTFARAEFLMMDTIGIINDGKDIPWK